MGRMPRATDARASTQVTASAVHITMDEEKRCCVLVDKVTKRISIMSADCLRMARMPTALMKFDPTKTDIIFEDCSEDDAKLYARMNSKDKYMAEKPVADAARAAGKYPYQGMDGKEYDAMFHRMDKAEYLQKVGAVKAAEEAEKAAEVASRKEDQRVRDSDCTGLKILYLYGYGTSEMLCEREQLAGLKEVFPNATIDVLEGFHQLTERKHFVCIEDNHPNLLSLWHAKTPLFCHAFHECPPSDPDDFTIQTCKGQSLQYAKPTKADMDAAVEKTAAHIVQSGGYQAVIGFSCGGEVVAQLIGKLAEINDQVATPTTFVGIFGSRCLYPKYGSPLNGRLPAGLKAVHIHGRRDDEDAFKVDKHGNKERLYDQQEFARLWAAAGIDTQTMLFDGGHEVRCLPFCALSPGSRCTPFAHKLASTCLVPRRFPRSIACTTPSIFRSRSLSAGRPWRRSRRVRRRSHRR